MGVILARHFRTSRWQEHEPANRLGKRRAKFMSVIRVATLLHRRLGYDRLLNGEVPAIVYLDEDGRLFSAPVFDDAARTLRFKLVSTGMRGATYSLLLHDCDFQFTVSHTDGTLVLVENGEFSQEDATLLQKLLRHLETASKRTLVRRRPSNNSLWERLFRRQHLPEAMKLRHESTIHGQKNAPTVDGGQPVPVWDQAGPSGRDL